MAKHDDETVTLTTQALRDLVASQVAAAMALARPPAMTADEEAAAKLARDRPRGEPPQYVPAISRIEYGGTGASFLAVVARGRMVGLYHYTRPVGWEKTLPEGLTLDNGKGQLPARTKQYIYETWYKRDLQLVGRPLCPAYPMTPEEVEAASFGAVPADNGVGSSEAA